MSTPKHAVTLQEAIEWPPKGDSGWWQVYEALKQKAHGQVPDRPDIAEKAWGHALILLIERQASIKNGMAFASKAIRNKIIDLFRQEERTKIVHSDLAAATPDSPAGRAVIRESTLKSEEQHESCEVGILVKQITASPEIDDKDRTIFMDRLAGKSVPVIARTVGLTPRAVYWRLGKLRKVSRSLGLPGGGARPPPLKTLRSDEKMSKTQHLSRKEAIACTREVKSDLEAALAASIRADQLEEFKKLLLELLDERPDVRAPRSLMEILERLPAPKDRSLEHEKWACASTR